MATQPRTASSCANPWRMEGLPRRVLLVALALLLGLPLGATAQTVDQIQVEGNQNRAVIAGTATGQTFTPGLPGFLAGIELSTSISSSAPLYVELYSGGLRVGFFLVYQADQGGTPDSLDPSTVTGTYLDLTPFAIPSVVGTTQEIRLQSDPTPVLSSLRVAILDEYPGVYLDSGWCPQ